MKPGALDPLVKEMIYVAVSATNNCEYCIHSHTAGARAKGMTDEMFAELMAVAALANETNRPRQRLPGAGGRSLPRPSGLKGARARSGRGGGDRGGDGARRRPPRGRSRSTRSSPAPSR